MSLLQKIPSCAQFLNLPAFVVALTGFAAADVDKLEVSGKLTVTFEYEGKPAKGSLIVSNVASRQEWVDVSSISAEVPTKATYIFDLKPPGDQQPIPITFRDILPEFSVPENGERNIIVSVLPSDLPKPFEPVLFIREAGAEVRVESYVETDAANSSRRTLVSTIERPAGSVVVLDGVYSTEGSDPAEIRDFTCGNNCPHVYRGIDCSKYCFTCSSTCVSRGYWQANYNMCEGLTSTPPPRSEWEELPSGVGGFQLAVATRNDGAIYPQSAGLSGSGIDEHLKPPFETRSFPDFTVPAGDYLYSVTFGSKALAEVHGPQDVNLPVSIRDGRISNIIVRMPMSSEDLSQPFAIADTRLGAVVRDQIFKPTKDGFSLEITSPDPDPGTIWYAIALPIGVDPNNLEMTRYGDQVPRGLGFVSDVILDRPAVIIKSEGTRDSLQISWSTK